MNSFSGEFPKELLGASPREKLSYFRDKQVRHRKLESAALRLKEIIHSDKSVIAYIYGPTGIGKSTLLKKLAAHLNASFEFSSDEENIPVVLEVAAPPIGSATVYRDLFTRLILNIHGANKQKDEKARQVVETMLIGRDSTAAAKLMRRLEDAIRAKNVQIILIDEAQHLKAGKSGKLLQEQMDVLKYLADKTGTKLILCGTYELRRFADLSGQVARRSRVVHFERYFLNNSDIEEFKSIILSLEGILPLEEESQLVEQFEFLYEKSIGCIGILKDLLHAALAKTMAGGGKKVTKATLHQVALDNLSLIQIAQEAIEGEGHCKADHSSKLKRMIYGTHNNQSGQLPENPASPDNRPKRRVGKQKAAVTPVGGCINE